MPAEWDQGIMVLIFKGKDDIRDCSCYRVVKFLEYGIKGVEKVLEKGFIELIVNELQVGFMLEEGAIDAVFTLRILQKVYCAIGNRLYMCFWT